MPRWDCFFDWPLVYVNAGKARQTQRDTGLQLPRKMHSPNLSNSKLLTEKEIVNQVWRIQTGSVQLGMAGFAVGQRGDLAKRRVTKKNTALGGHAAPL
ncbi:hypothetical protein X474_19990 [Dethiosulfatarculus sandiegensis]|uniref:Uncharacterized protein n=1 Tax=Dethiosulfatarculus sandiegensis TaxID=1429043 RepID=A0A0D2JRZ3_9BACT|nr:hypothetical protein X474_19990 [Dethiosulfatarculus sandiegensis]